MLPTQASAQNSTTCETKLEKAKSIALRAVENAEKAKELADKANEERVRAIIQRDDYRMQRDTTRTDRDHLAGELAAVQNTSLELKQTNLDLTQKTSIYKARIDDLETSRWWWLAGGFGVGAAIVVTGAIVL